jgi:hypothetical protein
MLPGTCSDLINQKWAESILWGIVGLRARSPSALRSSPSQSLVGSVLVVLVKDRHRMGELLEEQHQVTNGVERNVRFYLRAKRVRHVERRKKFVHRIDQTENITTTDQRRVYKTQKSVKFQRSLRHTTTHEITQKMFRVLGLRSTTTSQKESHATQMSQLSRKSHKWQGQRETLQLCHQYERMRTSHITHRRCQMVRETFLGCYNQRQRTVKMCFPACGSQSLSPEVRNNQFLYRLEPSFSDNFTNIFDKFDQESTVYIDPNVR